MSAEDFEDLCRLFSKLSLKESVGSPIAIDGPTEIKDDQADCPMRYVPEDGKYQYCTK